ncbi:hypothetical protein TMEC54S_00569 [Thauera mechernichensis]|jgi:hypothetical protein
MDGTLRDELLDVLERIRIYSESKTASEPGLVIYRDGLKVRERFRAATKEDEENIALLRTWMDFWWGRARFESAAERQAAWKEIKEALRRVCSDRACLT